MIWVLICLSSVAAWGQGCSDAGFCSMGAMKPDQPFNKKASFKLRTMELSFYRGTTTQTPIIYSATADLNFTMGDRTSFQVKIPYQAIHGRLADTQGLSDLSLCVTRTVYASDKVDVNFSIGGKLPSNGSNKSIDGKPLPMYYQNSLGTYDGIAGLSVKTRDWLFATGIQHAFNKNKNEFTWATWPNFSDQPYLLHYSQANRLQRGTDVMLRAERNFRFSEFNMTLGLLPIWRITKDEIEINGQRVKVDGTQGLALSGITSFGYSFNVRSGIKVLLGHKLVWREKNPDGLTRRFISTVSYYYRF